MNAAAAIQAHLAGQARLDGLQIRFDASVQQRQARRIADLERANRLLRRLLRQMLRREQVDRARHELQARFLRRALRSAEAEARDLRAALLAAGIQPYGWVHKPTVNELGEVRQ